MSREQVKFYVSADEKKRLEILAKLRHMTVPAYAKTVALGVKIQQVKEIYVEQSTLEIIDTDKNSGAIVENAVNNNENNDLIMLDDETKAVFTELLSRSNDAGYITLDLDFNNRLLNAVRRLLPAEENNEEVSYIDKF